MQPSKATHVDSYIFDANVYIVEAMQLMMNDRLVDGFMDGWINKIYLWMDVWRDVWMDDRLDGWMDEQYIVGQCYFWWMNDRLVDRFVGGWIDYRMLDGWIMHMQFMIDGW